MKKNTVRVNFGALNSATALRTIVGKGPYHLASIGQDGSISYKKTRYPIKWVDKQKRQKRNGYFHHNVVKAGVNRKPRKIDFRAARYAHAEIDPRKGESAEDIIARVKKRVHELVRQGVLRRPTSMVVSGGGVHLYWRFKKPVTDIETVEAINRWLAELLDGDAAHDVSRLLRVPETMNYPNARKRAAGREEAMARLVYSHDETIVERFDGEHVLQRARKYTLDDFGRSDGASIERVVTPVNRAEAEDINPEPLLERFTSKNADEWRDFIKRTDKSKSARLIKKYTKDNGDFGRSEAMAGAATYMRGQDLTPEEIAAVLLNEEWRIGEHARDYLPDEEDMWRAIERVAGGKQAQKRTQSKFTIRSFSEVEDGDTDWIIEPILARGEFTMLEGQTEQLKSFMTVKLASMLSKRGLFPGQKKRNLPMNTLILTQEDRDRTVKRRLRASRADLSRVKCQGKDEKPMKLDQDDHLEELERLIQQHKIEVIVLDPYTDFLTVKDVSSYTQVSDALLPLRRLIDRLGLAVILVRHYRKQPGKAAERGIGSVRWYGLARLVLALGPDPDDAKVKILWQPKANISKWKMKPRRVTVIDGEVKFLGVSKLSEDELDKANDAPKPKEQSKLCRQVLLRYLKPGKFVPFKTIDLAMEAHSISSGTRDRVKAEMGVESKKRGKFWYWVLPKTKNVK